MSIGNSSPSPLSLNTPLPSTHRLKPSQNPDLWEYNSEELCESIAEAQTHPLSGPISRPIHRRRKVMRIKLGVTIATSRSLGKNLFERHHTLIDELKNEDSV